MIKNIQISFHDSNFGKILIATLENKLCGLEINLNNDSLYDSFISRANFNNYSATRVNNRHSDMIDKIIKTVNTAKVNDDIPIVLIGTDFQKKVWKAIKNIPVKSTASYKDIANSIGNSNAIRAVGTACGANPIAIFIPCHRIIRADGKLGEYRWGHEIKKQLLAIESK